MHNRIMKGLTLIILFSGLMTFVHAREKSIVKFGRDIVVEENMEVDDVVVVGGDVTVYGIVDGDAVAVGGSVTLGPEAIIRGNAVSIGGNINQDVNATIYGDIVEIGGWNITSCLPWLGPWGYWAVPWAFKIFTFLGMLALAIIVILLMPKQIMAVSAGIEKDLGKIILAGFIGVILIIPLAISLGLSIIGIPLIPLEIMGVILATIFGYIAVAQLIGDRALVSVNKPGRPLIGTTITGLVILWLVGLIPFLGWLIRGIIYLIGFGAVIAAVIYRKKSKPEIVPEE